MDKLDLATVPSFGREIRDSLFLLNKEVAFTNHGSFGTVPKPILDAQSALRAQVDADPDGWFRRQHVPLYVKACKEVAEFIGAPSGSVVLVNNATTAVSTVLNSLRLSTGDGLLITSLTYGACAIAAHVVCTRAGAELHKLDISLPVQSKEAIVELYRQYLGCHPCIKFALVDHITSPSAMLLPVKEITAVCQSRGVKVMIDGAHTPGQLELQVQAIGAEYYTGNLHKWLFSLRGCALLFVKEELQSTVHPLVVSHEQFSGLVERFAFLGTDDYTAYCLAPVALEFFNRIGGLPAVSAYNQHLLSWATELLCQRWGVKALPIPVDMQSPFLSVVGPLPSSIGEATVEVKEGLMERLALEYNVIGVIDVIDGQLWCRISAQVYNVKEDYQRLADAVADLMENASK